MEKRSARKKKSVVEVKKPYTEADRYHYDVEQAHAMRRRASNSSRSSLVVDVSTSPGGTAERDAVELGLRGLDEADILREEGHAKCALELYQSAIEVLIRYLRSPSSSQGSSPRYDSGAIEARVKVALTDAETVKSIVAKQQFSQASSTTESPFQKTCFSKIKQYLSSVRNDNGGGGASDLSPKNTPAPQPANNLRQTPQSTNPKNNNTKGESDLLVKAVLQDMYIPPSERQSITWNDIAGLRQAKQALQEAAILPLLRPDLFTGLRRPQNILLYGSPGTGKTMLVKAVAHESQCNLFVCTASALTSKWHGEGEKLLRALFRVANESTPSIIFLDEIDALLSTRRSEGEHEASRRFKTEFMVQMDSVSSNNPQVLVIACTNCPWDIDGAILRRFPKRIFVPLPDREARRALLNGLIKKAGKNSLTSRQISDLVERFEGFSGSDMAAIASEASFGPLRAVGDLDAIRKIKANDVRPITIDDFRDALQHATKSVTKELLNRYEEWNQQQAA